MNLPIRVPFGWFQRPLVPGEYRLTDYRFVEPKNLLGLPPGQHWALFATKGERIYESMAAWMREQGDALDRTPPSSHRDRCRAAWLATAPLPGRDWLIAVEVAMRCRKPEAKALREAAAPEPTPALGTVEPLR